MPAPDPEILRHRSDFPILERKVHGKPLAYLDNAATTQKPQVVIDAIDRYYKWQNANIHRGVYLLSQEATTAYEESRQKIARFINASDAREIVFTRGTTESINLVASSWGRGNLKPGDEIILTGMEHHSNIVPWQLIAEQTGARIKVIPLDDRGQLLMDEYAKLLTDRTKIVAVVQLSNSLGTINDIKTIAAMAHRRGALVLADGAQWVAHFPTNVRDWDVDFFAFSSHKIFGPTGAGILYGKANLLDSMPPYQGGGDMISSVTFEKTTYAEIPHKFEAGTPHIAGGIALGTAIDYVQSIGLDRMHAHEQKLLDYAQQRLAEIPGLRLVGTAKNKASVISFTLKDIHPHDIGAVLDAEGVAIRTGHHCCQPVMDRFQIPATARASLAFYNTMDDVDALITGIRKTIDLFK